VTAVESATRALELLAMGLLPSVSMIITDYWMAGMTGYELLKHVKESAALRGIYIVIMSSMTIVIYTFFKQNFTIALIAFHASTKKQVPHSSLQNRSLIYAKIRIHLRCFGSRFTLKST
jgi:CheY-like chemotaxis protein